MAKLPKNLLKWEDMEIKGARRGDGIKESRVWDKTWEFGGDI